MHMLAVPFTLYLALPGNRKPCLTIAKILVGAPALCPLQLKLSGDTLNQFGDPKFHPNALDDMPTSTRNQNGEQQSQARNSHVQNWVQCAHHGMPKAFSSAWNCKCFPASLVIRLQWECQPMTMLCLYKQHEAVM